MSDLSDVWGTWNEWTGEQTILFIGNGGVRRIQGTQVTILPGFASSGSSIWFDPDKYYFAAGGTVQWKRGLYNPDWGEFSTGIMSSYYDDIKGTGFNDIFVVGRYLEVSHFNGVTWRNFRNEVPFSSGTFTSLAVKGNIVAAVGSVAADESGVPRYGIVMVGKR